MAGKAAAIRVPYRNLGEVETEMVPLEAANRRRFEIGSDSRSSSPSPTPRVQDETPRDRNDLLTIVLSCTVAAGVQFGWALQLSLLTPYIQVQPCVGIWSDKCSSKYGRRRPFILAGSLLISVAVIIIGFSADLGYLLGDTKEDCRTFKGTRTRAAFVFVIGFWLLDLANNTVQGPARALLADLAGPDQRNLANAIFCSWMAVVNIGVFSWF